MKNKNAALSDTRVVPDVLLESQDIVTKTAFLFSRRFSVMILLFLSYINIAFQEFNINMATIEMTSNRTAMSANGTKIEQPPEFQWDSKTISLVISMSSYGKLLSFLSGTLISAMGGSTSWALSMLGSGIMTVLQTIAIRYSFYLFLACRFCSGVFQSFSLPSTTEAFSHWIPRAERATMTSVCYNGFYIGIALVHPICGLIASEWGWQKVFYVIGAASVTLSLVCLLLVPNRPSDDKWISRKELAHILKETDTSSRPRKAATTPYKDIFRSTPVWALSAARFVASCVVTTLLSSLPLFIKDATNKDTKQVAFLSSLPNFVVILFSLFSGGLLDYWKNHSNITPTRLHKTVLGSIFAIQSISFVALTFLTAGNLIATIIIFVLIRALQSFVIIILQLTSLTIAPNHSGLVAGFTLFWYSFGTIVAQVAAGFLTTNHTLDEWNRCFLLTAGITFFGLVTFTVFGSSEPQWWSLSSNLEKQSNLSNKMENELLREKKSEK